MIAVTVIVVILALIAGYCVALYNGLIRERNQVKLAWVNSLNVRIETFPDELVAGLFGFVPAHALKFSAEKTADVDLAAAFAKSPRR